jgi:tRNA A-37 threonylcarbamoyl transferase component Bud32
VVTTGRQILDKYELLEKVGQGGMAIVYRGVDTTLRRQVAVKVLHRHLADHKEARDRFEREAQAVAKLRHENILEIFDFSGVESEESYIVTEFIDGQTLKEFVGEHPIRYPEVGAMITVQVCRALSHAHSLGVLHRDVKPENIMIRNDGVVKLTDFGIAQMLDHQRLTVTGQLLGSPAYMSPEHVEGGKLDFRTDVFAVGIVLYQLATGELPFRGKNPHEILKRIAECSYTDPRQMSPLIGNELAGILRRSLAREKDDRYADVSQMVAALEGYLSGSGLGSARDELARFFNAPVSYEMALRPRLVAALAKRGLAKLADDRNAALEIFNRVLTMDPENAEVLSAIERLSRHRRWVRGAGLGAGLLAVAVGGFFLRENLRAEAEKSAPAATTPATTAGVVTPPASRQPVQPPARLGPPEGEPRPTQTPVDPPPERRVDRKSNGAGLARADAGPAARAEGEPRRFTLSVYPHDAEYRVDDGPWRKISGKTASVELSAGETRLVVRKQPCCDEREQIIGADDRPGGTIHVELPFMPGSVRASCKVRGVTVQVDGQSATLGHWRNVMVDGTTGSKEVTVTFVGASPDQIDDQTVVIEAGVGKDVACRL